MGDVTRGGRVGALSRGPILGDATAETREQPTPLVLADHDVLAEAAGQAADKLPSDACQLHDGGRGGVTTDD